MSDSMVEGIPTAGSLLCVSYFLTRYICPTTQHEFATALLLSGFGLELVPLVARTRSKEYPTTSIQSHRGNVLG